MIKAASYFRKEFCDDLHYQVLYDDLVSKLQEEGIIITGPRSYFSNEEVMFVRDEKEGQNLEGLCGKVLDSNDTTVDVMLDGAAQTVNVANIKRVMRRKDQYSAFLERLPYLIRNAGRFTKDAHISKGDIVLTRVNIGDTHSEITPGIFLHVSSNKYKLLACRSGEDEYCLTFDDVLLYEPFFDSVLFEKDKVHVVTKSKTRDGFVVEIGDKIKVRYKADIKTVTREFDPDDVIFVKRAEQGQRWLEEEVKKIIKKVQLA